MVCNYVVSVVMYWQTLALQRFLFLSIDKDWRGKVRV